MKKIPIAKPYLDASETDLVAEVLKSGWLVQGKHVAEFERLFAAFAGAPFAVALSNCTTALHVALDALGIGAGHKVIVPAFTYIASANAVEYTGAAVAFCDIDLRTFNIDLAAAEELLAHDAGHAITAIMPVNLFGLCADLPGVLRLAERYDLKVIEDSACGLGALIGNKHSGTFGQAGCFSFHPRKSITTGEGGMLITPDENVYQTARSLRDHGAALSDSARHNAPGGYVLPDFPLRGYNYRMTDMQGALGVCQMRKAEHILNTKRALAARYDQALAGTLITPAIPAGYTHGYQAYVGLYPPDVDPGVLSQEEIDALSARRNRLMAALEARGIATRQGTHAVHTLAYYRDKYGLKAMHFPRAYAADRLSLALPLYAELSTADQDYVIENIMACIREGRG